MTGTLSVVVIAPELLHRKSVIGTAILESNKNIKVVARRDGHYQGTYRTIGLEIIAGENRLETIHKEFDIKFKLNPGDVYFSVRSSTERKRIADLVAPGETVLVMFSGIAPYLLHIAKFSEASTIIGIEKNRIAHRYAQENLVLNKVKNRIELFEGDVDEIVPQLDSQFDRIVMPLPKSSLEYLELALGHLRPGGVIHYYFIHPPDMLYQSVIELEKNVWQQAGIWFTTRPLFADIPVPAPSGTVLMDGLYNRTFYRPMIIIRIQSYNNIGKIKTRTRDTDEIQQTKRTDHFFRLHLTLVLFHYRAY